MKRILFLLALFSTTILNAQDVIVKKDGSTIICKVVEIGTSEVKYKKYSNLEGPLYTLIASDIQIINYENGDQESFKQDVNSNDASLSNPHDIILNYGVEIPIQIVSPIRARDVNEGDEVSFRTITDVVVDGIKVIPSGTPVRGLVYQADRSSCFGTKGKLGIRLDHLTLLDGSVIPLKGDIYVTGKNRTTLSVLLFLFVTWPACFICGTKAELPSGYETMAKLGASVQFAPNGKPTILSLEDNRQPKYDPINLSSSDSIPDLPSYATLVYTNGEVERVNIYGISLKKGVVKYFKSLVSTKNI